MFARRAIPRALLAFVVLACVGHAALASQILGSPPKRLIGVPYQRVELPGWNAATQVCQLGEHGALFSTLDILDLSAGDDLYYTWVAAESCSACNNSDYASVANAHVALYFPSVPETVTVNAGIVGVNRITCRYQDPTLVLCSPVQAKLAASDPASAVDFAIPLGTSCHLDLPPNSDGQGFLLLDFTAESDTTIAHRAQFMTQAVGHTCRSYNALPLFYQDITTEYQCGNPIMYVDVEACVTDAVRGKSWGQLKTIYR